MIRAGRLNRTIIIEALTQTKDSHGGVVDVWQPIAFGAATDGKVRAAVVHLSGKEKRLQSKDGTITEAVTEFTIRYKANLTATMRIVYEGLIYNIKHINDLNGAHRVQIITCDTGLNDGR